MFNIKDYIWDIYEISHLYNLDNVSIAFDMFIENLELGYNRYGNEISSTYSSISKSWSDLSINRKKHVKSVFDRVIDGNRKELYDAFISKDKDRFNKICKCARAGFGIS